jgi:uncharacterized protein YbbC (DUF1343 family)
MATSLNNVISAVGLVYQAPQPNIPTKTSTGTVVAAQAIINPTASINGGTGIQPNYIIGIALVGAVALAIYFI